MDKQTEIMILTGLSSLSTAVAALIAMQPARDGHSMQLAVELNKSADNLSMAAQGARDNPQKSFYSSEDARRRLAALTGETI